MDQYKTIAVHGLGEYEEKKSRFLGEAIPVTSEEEIQEHLTRIRKQYYDARHHCFAYVLGEKSDQKRASDDGEPQGTAGAPILKVIEGNACTNLLIVVTRYFGGTLLGTGGLVRAYTAAAKNALENAGICTMMQGEILQLNMEYRCLDQVQYLMKKQNILADDIQYTDRVVILCKVPASKKEEFEHAVFTSCGDGVRTDILETGFYSFPE